MSNSLMENVDIKPSKEFISETVNQIVNGENTITAKKELKTSCDEFSTKSDCSYFQQEYSLTTNNKVINTETAAIIAGSVCLAAAIFWPIALVPAAAGAVNYATEHPKETCHVFCSVVGEDSCFCGHHH